MNKLQVHTRTILDGSGNGLFTDPRMALIFKVFNMHIGKYTIPVESMEYIDIQTKTD